jgi:nucleoid-associated protein YgaU
MPSRYQKTPKLDGGRYLGTSRSSSVIFYAAQTGQLSCNVRVLKGRERLDTIAADTYGNASYWWVIAAATGIGWCLQVPPGTTLRVPKNLGKALALVRR